MAAGTCSHEYASVMSVQTTPNYMTLAQHTARAYFLATRWIDQQDDPHTAWHTHIPVDLC